MTYRFIIDAEVDGLYGPLLTLAVLIADQDGQVIEEFYAGLPKNLASVETEWVKTNVLPFVGNYHNVDSEEELLDQVWRLWASYGKSAICYADVPFPVETGIWHRIMARQEKSSEQEGPFPLIDLASILLAKGINPLTNRLDLARKSFVLHNALDDVRLTNHLLTLFLGGD